MTPAIKQIQVAFKILATRCGYDANTNTFANPDSDLCEAIQHLHAAIEAIYEAEGIDAIDLQSRPELWLSWAFANA